MSKPASSMELPGIKRSTIGSKPSTRRGAHAAKSRIWPRCFPIPRSFQEMVLETVSLHLGAALSTNIRFRVLKQAAKEILLSQFLLFFGLILQ